MAGNAYKFYSRRVPCSAYNLVRTYINSAQRMVSAFCCVGVQQGCFAALCGLCFARSLLLCFAAGLLRCVAAGLASCGRSGPSPVSLSLGGYYCFALDLAVPLRDAFRLSLIRPFVAGVLFNRVEPLAGCLLSRLADPTAATNLLCRALKCSSGPAPGSGSAVGEGENNTRESYERINI